MQLNKNKSPGEVNIKIS